MRGRDGDRRTGERLANDIDTWAQRVRGRQAEPDGQTGAVTWNRLQETHVALGLCWHGSEVAVFRVNGRY